MSRTSSVQDQMNQAITQAQQTLNIDTDLKAGDLIIENERLKTTIMVLNKKLNDWKDTESEQQILKKKFHELNVEKETQNGVIQSLKSQVSLKDNIITVKENSILGLNEKLSILNHELEEMSKSKDMIKKDNSELSDKVIQLEEDIYKSKSVSLQLIEQLKNSEKELRDITEFSKTKIKEIEEL